jgi:hypothetical protein
MQIIGWILFVLALGWHVYSLRYNHIKRFNLEDYAVCLLIDDEFRNSHKENFKSWISRVNALNAFELTRKTRTMVESWSDILANGSPLHAHTLLWNSEHATELRARYNENNPEQSKP